MAQSYPEEDNIREFADEKAKRAKDPPKGSAGVDGESWYMDVWAGGPDVNPDLTGILKWMVYQEMRLGDPAVRSVLLMFKLPIRSALWDVDASSDSPEDQVIAEACRWAFGLGENEDGQMIEPWDQSIERTTLFLDWGSWWEEIIWSPEPVEFESSTGQKFNLRTVLRLAPRSPTTLKYPDGIVIDKATGAIKWIEQDLPGAKKIPGDKLCHYINGFEGTNYFGVSALRPMYGPWKLKKALMIAAGIGWDRWALGIPRVTYPANNEEEKKAAEQIGREVRGHERAYVVQPAGENYGFEVIAGSGSVMDPTGLLRHYDEQIALAGLQGFTRLGVSETGSRAVGETLAAPYYQAVLALAAQIADSRRKYLLRRFVDVNFGPDWKVPKLRVTRIQAKDPTGIAGIIAELAAVGFNFADAPTQAWLRALLEMPQLPDVSATDQGTVLSGPGQEPAPELPPPEEPPPDTSGGNSQYTEGVPAFEAFSEFAANPPGKKALVQEILDVLPLLERVERRAIAREVLDRRIEFEEHPNRIRELHARVMEKREEV